MFTDTVSHRLSNGVEAFTDGLHMHIDVVCIVELWFRAKADLALTAKGNSMYCWPWREARKYLLLKKGNAACAIENKDLPKPYQTIACYPKGWELYFEDNALDRIAAILVDDADAFDILHWCLTTLGGSDD